MAYTVKFDSICRERLSSWAISDEFKAMFVSQIMYDLENLPPDELGIRVTEGVRCAIYRTVLADPDPQSNDRRDFTLWVNDTHRPGTRLVLDIDCSN